MTAGEFVFKPTGVRRRSRPRACPRLTVVPVRKKCPAGYDAAPSKADATQTCCKRQTLIPLKRGTLSRFGYSAANTQPQRRAALKRAMEHHGWLRVFRKLNAVMVYAKGNPRLHGVFKADRDWVRRTGKPKAQSTSVKVKRERENRLHQ
jgi:hypothetical protein